MSDSYIRVAFKKISSNFPEKLAERLVLETEEEGAGAERELKNSINRVRVIIGDEYNLPNCWSWKRSRCQDSRPRARTRTSAGSGI